jgi:Fungal specific transcription factor domain
MRWLERPERGYFGVCTRWTGTILGENWPFSDRDRFCSANLGLPVLISDREVQCEYPFDVEENLEKQSESTKTSSALALFKLARVLSKILEDLYAVQNGQMLLFKTVASLQDALDAWSSELAPPLRLHFEKDKPSAGTVHSRAPILVGSSGSQVQADAL